jgi:pyroglutamyl-peptidase
MFKGRTVVARAPTSLASTIPCGLIAAALRRAGFDAAVSIDAGDYVCNQTLFLSLKRAYAPVIGFIHVPPHRRLAAARCLSLEEATRAAATVILALAPSLRQRARFDPPPVFA